MRRNGNGNGSTVNTEGYILKHRIKNRCAVRHLNIRSGGLVYSKLICSVIIRLVAGKVGTSNVYGIDSIYIKCRKGELPYSARLLCPVRRVLCILAISLGREINDLSLDITSCHDKVGACGIEVFLKYRDISRTCHIVYLILHRSSITVINKNYGCLAVNDDLLLVGVHCVLRCIGKRKRKLVSTARGKSLQCLPYSALRVISPLKSDRHRAVLEHRS